ncbi:hypothetical protein FB446DRAFT_791542 [Lentinula raphanica]|nr:hypothetical protein FB446DRAFT_791542 [Lentinula raphanica]
MQLFSRPTKKLGRIAIVVFLFSAVALAMPIGSESESEFNANELSHPSSASPDLVYRDLVPHTEESSDSLPSYEDAVRAGAGVLSSSHTGAASSSSSAIIKAEVKCNHDANSEEFKKAVKTMSESKPVIDRHRGQIEGHHRVWCLHGTCPVPWWAPYCLRELIERPNFEALPLGYLPSSSNSRHMKTDMDDLYLKNM